MKTIPEHILQMLADEYEKQALFEENYRKEKEKQINSLKLLIASSYERPIYKLIYKEEYGDFREFAEQVAKVLRKRNKV